MYRYECEVGFYESDYYIGLMWEILKHRTWHLFTHGKWMDQEKIMDIGILNELGYFEVIEISLWVGLMYFGKCWIDDYFRRSK